MEIILIVLTIVYAVTSFLMIMTILRKTKEIKHGNKQYQTLVNLAADYVLKWNTDFSAITASEPLVELIESCGKKVDVNLIASIFGNGGTSNYSPAELMVNAVSKGGRESAIVSGDGKVYYFKWYSEIVETIGTVVYVSSVGRDITEVKLLSNELDTLKHNSVLSQECFSVAVESAKIGIVTITVDEGKYIFDISEEGKKLLNLNIDQNVTVDILKDHMSPADVNYTLDVIRKLFSNTEDIADFEIKFKMSDDTFHSFMMKFKCVKTENSGYSRITGAFMDVTSQRENYKLYDRSAYEDILTGLPNSRGFIVKAEKMLIEFKAKEINAALIALRIEKFQKMATLFGINIADQLLKIYADSISKCIGENGIVGKMSNDVFAVLIKYSEKEEIERFAKNLSYVVENYCNGTILPVVLKEQAKFVAGICFYDGYDDIMALYNKANITLFTDNKLSNTVCRYFDEELEKKVCRREFIEQEIIDAMKNNEFELYYQPKFGFKSQKLIGVEALMRWNHPKNGIVGPNEFIHIAEEIGYITKIDEWGLTQACLQNKRWQDMGFETLKVSVNISQAQLYQTDLVASVKRALTESGLEPKYLEIELTETMAIQDIDLTIRILKQIKEIGVSISMDDFGTGYSSLSSLKILPIDTLKIDRSLVFDIEKNETSRNIVKAIVELGKAMNLEILAEGVETEEQCQLLTDLGCDIAQGFFYGKPICVSELERKFLQKIEIEEK